MSASSFDPRLTTYFGDATLQAGFLPLPHLFLRHYAQLGISGQQAMFLQQIMACTWDLGSQPQNLSQIAARMGIARRTAQALSAELHNRGFIQIYDQYDEDGAQIENGYDLSPLFELLSQFAPASTPSGTQRQPRARTATVPPSAEKSEPAAPLAENSTPPWQKTAPPPGRKQHPPLDREIQAPQQESAGLKEELKNLHKKALKQKQEQQQKVAAAAVKTEQNTDLAQTPSEAGRSLRWDIPLSTDAIRRSRQLLARMGLNANVADAVALGLHPAEVWGLWLYADSCGLGPAWIATQVYDTRLQQPRLPGIPASCDAAGRALAAVSPEVAWTILESTKRFAPDHLEAARNAVVEVTRDEAIDDVYAAFDAAWAAASAVQPSRSRSLAVQPPTSATRVQSPAAAEDPRWVGAKTILQAHLPESEYMTWIAPLALLHAGDASIVVGVSNCFVRGELEGTYTTILQDAVAQAWQRPMAIEVAIDEPEVA